MSPRTTLVLLLLVAAAAGGIYLFTRGDAPATPKGRQLLPGLVTADVRRMTITCETPDEALKGRLVVTREAGDRWSVETEGAARFRARAERVAATLEALREASFLKRLSGATREEPWKFGFDAGRRVIVVLDIEGGGTRSVTFGATVSEGGVAALVDDQWPPVEVDYEIRAGLVESVESWRELRFAPFDPSIAEELRVTFPATPANGFVARRESGRWEIREPALLQADQNLLMRLLASLVALKNEGALEAAAGDPEVFARYEVRLAGVPEPAVVEIGNARKGDHAAVRGGTSGPWGTASLAGLDLVGRPAGDFRSRRLLHVEAADIHEVVIAWSGRDPLRFARGGGGILSLHAPESWQWRFLGKPRVMALDPAASADFLQWVIGFEAADLTPGAAFEPDFTLDVIHGAARTETRLRIGPAAGGLRPVARFEEAALGHVRDVDLAYVRKPFWELLARQVYGAMWFSIAEIEIEEVGRRKVTVSAVSTAGTGPDFAVGALGAQSTRRIPQDVMEPLIDKLAFFSVEEFVAMADPKEFGLDTPLYRVTFLDSAKSQGVAPDPNSGQRVTWLVGPRGPDGLNHGVVSITPGLIFKTSARDLDPVINVLEWVKDG